LTQRPRFTLERTFDASPQEVWDLWTTKEGMEAWMGPDGFSVVVGELDVRPGGKLVYAMSAVGADQIAYMKHAGMPLTTEQHVEFVEVDPPRRLVYRDIADFIPGVEPYMVETVVELSSVAGGTRMVLAFEAMHDARWTEMARLGREMELQKMERVLAARS
jgi:uncharacterized protein YndB with AHSA1/START domain